MAEPPSIFCPSCGTPSAPGTHFCASCGGGLPEHLVGPSPAPTEAVGVTPPAGPEGWVEGGSPSAPGPGAPMPGQQPGSNRAWWIIGGVALVAMMVIGGGLAAFLLLRGGGESATAEEVVLEPVGVETPDPLTNSVATQTEIAPPETLVRVPAPQGGSAGGQQLAGAQPGLFGGTRNNATCDQEKLIDFLGADQAKGAAWAKVQGVAQADLPAYLRSLTPVTLTRDTRVTNHGWRKGNITTINSVLQAGTAVMVDDYGVPRAKCGCGNPLVEPKALTTSSRYVGTRWAGFAPERNVVIAKESQVNNFILVNVEDGSLFSRAPGTSGASDEDVAADQLCELFPDDPSCGQVATSAVPTTGAAPKTAPTVAPRPVATAAPRPVPTAVTTPEPTAAPTPAPTAPPETEPEPEDRSEEAAGLIGDAIESCAGLEYIDTIQGYGAGRSIYTVDVHVVLDSGDWTASYTVDLDSGRIVAADQDSADLACM
jgi:hypothetical protein